MKEKKSAPVSKIFACAFTALLIVLIHLSLRTPAPQIRTLEPVSSTSHQPAPNKSRLELSARDVYSSIQNRSVQDPHKSEAYLDISNKDPRYRKKLGHHHRIGAFVESPLKNDPEMREILTYLLENGYGIDNWAGVVNYLYSDSFLVRAAIKKMRDAGVPPDEIENVLHDPAPEPGTPPSV